MRIFVKTLSVLALASLFVAGCKEPVQEEPISIKLNKGLISNLPVGSTQTLVATVLPEGADVTVAWTSDNENIAVVNDEGEVTGIAPGTAVISAQAEDAVATCKVTVTAVKPEKIALSSSNLELPVGTQHLLEVVLTPSNAVAEDVVWSSSNKTVATIENSGLVTALAEGNTTITVKCNGGMLAAVCQVKVIGKNDVVLIESISVQPASLNLEVGDESDLALVVNPDNAVVENVVWTSNNASVVSVDAKGHVKALSAGDATVTVKCNDGAFTADCQIKVAAKDEPTPGPSDPVKVAEIQMPSTLELNAGEEKTLEVTVLPADAENKALKFTSDNECVTVGESTGKVKAVKAGTAKVTAEALDGSGVKAVCTVTVKAENSVESVVLYTDNNQTDLQVGIPLQIKAVFNPSGVKPNSVSWTLDRTDLADIDQNGLVTGKFANKNTQGTWDKVNVIITADGVSASMPLRVIPRQPESIEVDMPETGWIRVGQEWNFNPRVLPEELGYGVTCSIMKPGNKFTSDATLSSDIPGTIAAQFAVATHENLVYSSYRRDVSLNVLPYWVESITLPETQEMEVGGSLVLSPEFTSDADGVQPTYRDVKWSSSDQSVASINEKTGEIIAHAAGQTTITVTTANEWSVPGGQAQKSATCILTVKVADSGLNVGDYFYSDGTWSSELQSGKTVVGVVFAKANATAADPVLAKDFPNCTHGLVLGLTEYVDQDFGSVSCYNGHGYYTNLGYDASSIVDVEKQNGYGNSKAHRDLNASKADYVALFNAESGVIATQTNAVATPSGASSWYVPSYKEMSMILANYDTVNAAIVSAGGMVIATPNPIEDSWDDNRTSDWYWTSTIYGIPYGASYDHYKYAFDISRGAWTTSQQTSAKCKVRVVFAF